MTRDNNFAEDTVPRDNNFAEDTVPRDNNFAEDTVPRNNNFAEEEEEYLVSDESDELGGDAVAGLGTGVCDVSVDGVDVQ